MRSHYLAALAGALLLGLPALPAYAQGNVLVPQDTPDQATTDSQGNSVTVPQTTNQPSLPKLDPNEEDTTGTSMMSPIPYNNGNNDSGNFVNGSASSYNPHVPGQPTQVLKMESAEAPSIPGDESLPENVKISLKDYLWGPEDIATVNQVLHIPKEEVPKICHLSLTGMLNSDSQQASYFFDMGTSFGTVSVGYEGKSSGITIMARALCDKVALPPDAGMVLQVGEKYVVLVNTSMCPPPSKPTGQTLTFKYAGNGKASCLYQ